MTSVSVPDSWSGHRPAPWLALSGPVVAVGALLGLWWTAGGTEEAVRRQTDSALAMEAAAYFSVVTPWTPAGYDAPRLLSTVNVLVDGSFWPGGIQVALGNVALATDTIGLAPLPQELLDRLAQPGVAVRATHARRPVSVLPFLGRDSTTIAGWVGAWDSLAPQVPGLRANLISVVAFLAICAAGLAFLREQATRFRLVALAVSAGLILVLGADLGWSVRLTARSSTDLRLLIARRLIEVAATGAGVRQARLPEIAGGLTVELVDLPSSGQVDVQRVNGPDGPRATIVAATPRTRDGLRLSMKPTEAELLGCWVGLTSWVLLATLALAGSTWVSRPRDEGSQSQG
ncbi:MAG: hypothetical protein ABI587_09130 [Gemmatimonadales bacterium]